MTSDLKALCIADFNLANFKAILQNDREAPRLRVDEHSLVSVPAAMIEAAGASLADPLDLAFIWARPESTLASFRNLLEGHPVSDAALDEDVRAFGVLVGRLSLRVKRLFVASWILPPWLRSGPRAFQSGVGASFLLARANFLLAQHVASFPNVAILDSGAWVEPEGAAAWNEKLWYAAKVPFSPSVFKIAAREIKSALRNLGGQARKLLILDLDDTLWGGIIGDDGLAGVRLGGHDPVGEAYRDFQLGLQALRRRGVILGIVSKNDETVALEAIRSHPEMVLKLDDFAGWRINWSDKAQNIVDLAAELRLGLQSVVFIDDNPFERGRVREALPEVLVPEWPESKLAYLKALQSLTCFHQAAVSGEDLRRTELYRQERHREQARLATGSLDEWLGSLRIVVKVAPLNRDDLPRAAQLLNKTNQMNLRTRRLTEAEFWDWSSAPDHAVWSIRVSDKFGDAGLTGILGLEMRGDTAFVPDFVLSCRVMGRKVEDAMIAFLVAEAARRGAKNLLFEFSPTSKNKPCLDFFSGGNLQREGNETFLWPLSQPWQSPQAIQLIVAS